MYVLISEGKSNQDPISYFSAMQGQYLHVHVFMFQIWGIIFQTLARLGMWFATFGRAVVLGMPSVCNAEVIHFLFETP